jgi:hypothetical protein
VDGQSGARAALAPGHAIVDGVDGIEGDEVADRSWMRRARRASEWRASRDNRLDRRFACVRCNSVVVNAPRADRELSE